ncbi:hypothetical protein AXG93_1855s1080 [Marchantia polymorpha subsp. ruderalis]|uniref:Uncharacterized protein n=1 Tax=Marchantia polymorpha subsp. ruderalis TaxID=1480154 RepID=A0A176VMK1_MARPO|nr:hypothetical protein AXG93_1855s1080 [Marchantia polymorpha subsp. ruderalis]
MAPHEMNDKVRKLVPLKSSLVKEPKKRITINLEFHNQTTARGPVKVDVLPNQEKSPFASKRRKVVTDDEEYLMFEERRAEKKIEGVRQSRTRARSKRKASRGLVVIEASVSNVEKTVAPTNASAKVARDEPIQPMVIERSSAVPVEVPVDATVEPSKKRTEIVSPNSLSSELTQSVGSEDVPQLKMGGEVATEFTLSEAILKQIVWQRLVGLWGIVTIFS